VSLAGSTSGAGASGAAARSKQREELLRSGRPRLVGRGGRVVADVRIHAQAERFCLARSKLSSESDSMK